MTPTKILLAILAIIVIGSSLLLQSCDRPSHGPPFEKTYDRTGEFIRVKVVFHDDYESLTKAYFKYLTNTVEMTDREKRDFLRNHRVAGFALIPMEASDENYYCVIHQMRPHGQNDLESKRTLGHEMLHCLYGSWHPEWHH